MAELSKVQFFIPRLYNYIPIAHHFPPRYDITLYLKYVYLYFRIWYLYYTVYLFTQIRSPDTITDGLSDGYGQGWNEVWGIKIRIIFFFQYSLIIIAL